mgnify:FL=1
MPEPPERISNPSKSPADSNLDENLINKQLAACLDKETSNEIFSILKDWEDCLRGTILDEEAPSKTDPTIEPPDPSP